MLVCNQNTKSRESGAQTLANIFVFTKSLNTISLDN